MSARIYYAADCGCVWGRDEDGQAECVDDDCWCVRHCRCEDCEGRRPCDCEEDDDE